MTRQFYKPEPTTPEKSQIARALKWSLRVSVVGWAFYGPFAFAFADLGIIPAAVQSTLVLLGSALIVVGSETNTIPTLIAALSKVGTGRFSAWDLSAVLASLVGSLCNVLITFSTRQVKLAGTPWREFSVVKGPLFLGIATTLDMYGAVLEKAFIKRDYERDWATWWKEKLAWDEKYGIVPELPQSPRIPIDPRWPTADINDARRAIGRLNGSRTDLDREGLEQALARDQLRMDVSSSTVRRWLELAKGER